MNCWRVTVDIDLDFIWIILRRWVAGDFFSKQRIFESFFFICVCVSHDQTWSSNPEDNLNLPVLFHSI